LPAEDNKRFITNAEIWSIVEMTVAYYDRVGYNLPWIGYVDCCKRVNLRKHSSPKSFAS
jgi:hypothetical protein